MKRLILFFIALSAWGQIPAPGGGGGAVTFVILCPLAVSGELIFDNAGVCGSLTGSSVTNNRDAEDNYFSLLPLAPTANALFSGLAGNEILIQSAAGGATSNSIGTGGEAGRIRLLGAEGGVSTGTTDPVGGTGGGISIIAGRGADTSTGIVSNTSGDGNDLILVAGTAGTANHANTENTAGDPGTASLISGGGGSATGGGTAINLATAGADVLVAGGAGGVASGGATNTPGAGGNVILEPGTGGTGDAAGTDGTVIAKGGGNANANIQEWQTSAGNKRASVSASGTLMIDGAFPAIESRAIFGGGGFGELFMDAYAYNVAASPTQKRFWTIDMYSDYSAGAAFSNGYIQEDFLDNAGIYVTARRTDVNLTDNTTRTVVGGGVVNQANTNFLVFSNATQTRAAVRAGSAQTLHLQEWQNNAGTAQLAVDAVGQIIGQTANAPAVSGCTAAAIVAGSTGIAGQINSTPTGACAVTLTFDKAAPTGWSCAISNQTTANLIRQTASTTTTAVFTGVTVAGDVLAYGPCVGW